jgi:tetrahydromethanopterin S-methyltransferase subunit D
MDTLARLAPRLALGVAIALGLGVGFVPTVIHIYNSGGSLAGWATPGAIAAFSLAVNAVLVTVAFLALRAAPRRGPPRG